jgi:antitoxin HicB
MIQCAWEENDMKFTVLLTPDPEDGGYVAECPTIPGCISEGDTVEEALANIKDAIEGCLESLAANQQPLPDDQPMIVATVEVDAPNPVAV